jgi:hypothetical protein
MGSRVGVVLGRDLGQHAGHDDAGRRRGECGLALQHGLFDGDGDPVRPGLYRELDRDDRRCPGAGRRDWRRDGMDRRGRRCLRAVGAGAVRIDRRRPGAGRRGGLLHRPLRHGDGVGRWPDAVGGRRARGAGIGRIAGTELWAVMYDFGSVVEGDRPGGQPDRLRRLLLLCAGVRQNCGPPQPPYTCWADFDKSGLVDFGDLSFFAPNFAKSRDRGAIGRQTLVFPPNFPDAWRGCWPKICPTGCCPANCSRTPPLRIGERGRADGDFCYGSAVGSAASLSRNPAKSASRSSIPKGSVFKACASRKPA